MDSNSQTKINQQKPEHQLLTKYNRESGKKTLIFMGIIISAIVILSLVSLLLLITKPKTLTSSIENQPDKSYLQK